MKNKMLIITAVVFVAVMVSAVLIYPKLAQRYSSDETQDNAGTNALNSADDFTVYDFDMNKVKLSDSFGKPIVVNFWATWCGPCKSELPAFNAMYEKYKDDVVFLMVNLTDGQNDIPDGVKKFISENGYGFPVYCDIEYDAAERYGVRSIPETLFINADGSLCNTRVGAMSEAVLENYIKRIIGEER